MTLPPPSSMLIRAMRQTDIPACVGIMLRCDLWQRYGVTESSAAARFEEGLCQHDFLFVAEDQAGIVGFAWVSPRGAFCRSPYLKLIGVAPECQGRGVGDLLMDHAEKIAREQAHDFFLLVSDFNHDAQRFYQRRGFREIGQIPNFAKNGITELIYYKQFAQEKK